MRIRITFILLLIANFSLVAQDTDYTTESNIKYYQDAINKSDPYISERCVLDIYYPKNKPSFATIVWFHGGGLTGGQKELPEALKQKGVAVVGVNYRLYPRDRKSNV